MANNFIGSLTSTPGTGPGNVISGNTVEGIEFEGTGVGNSIAGNLIGTTAGGLAALGNGGDGVLIQDGSNLSSVGGPNAGAGNVISGSVGGYGVNINKSSNSLVDGNIIGLDINGANAIPNRFDGVIVQSGGPISPAANNQIGGTTPNARNIISGNSRYGVDLYGSGVTSTFVEGNYIGSDKTGTRASGNALYGVYMDLGANNNFIGGQTATPGTGAGNLISGNVSGIELVGASTISNLFEGNLIGPDITGGASLGIQQDGVYDSSPSNTFGGTTSGSRNIFSGNASTSLDVEAANTVIEGNYFGTDSTGMFAVSNFNDIVLNGANVRVGNLTSTPGTGGERHLRCDEIQHPRIVQRWSDRGESGRHERARDCGYHQCRRNATERNEPHRRRRVDASEKHHLGRRRRGRAVRRHGGIERHD